MPGSDTLRRKRHTGGSLKGTIKRVFGKRKSDPIREEDISPVNKENDRRWKNKLVTLVIVLVGLVLVSLVSFLGYILVSVVIGSVTSVTILATI